MKWAAAIVAIAVGPALAKASDGREPAPHLVQGRRPKGIKEHQHPNIHRVGSATFTQRLDHTRGSASDTFEQRYWYDAASWKGQGSPIFLFNPGETEAKDMLGYLSNETLPGMLADLYGGAVLLLEHRYFGKSMPFPTLTAETLQYLNLPNSIHDHIHFAQTVSLPFDAHNETHPSKSPWVLIGGSYSGALAAWTQHIMPGTFYAYHASSAVVQAIYEFDEYFAPIEAALPRNCSRDVQAVVARVDRVLTRDDPGEVAHLKNLFGLADIEHHDDFAELITIPLWKWQNEPEEVHAFCDHIQLYADDDEDDDDDVEEEPQGSHVGGRKGKKGRRDTDDEKGVGVEIALKAYADWVDRTVGPICESYICDTYRNPEAFNQPTNVDGDRQWYWFLCNEPLAFWQVGPPSHSGSAGPASSIVSSFLTTHHWQRRCDLWFPETNGFISGSSMGFTVEHENLYTGGWNSTFERVTFVDGELDPWLGATVNSPNHPGGPLAKRNGGRDGGGKGDQARAWVIPGGNHVGDLVLDEGAEMAVLQRVFDVHGDWLADWTATA